MLARGQQILEELFGGLTATLVAQGVPVGDMLANARLFLSGHRLRQARTGLVLLSASRPVLEGYVRARVRALPNVAVLDSRDVVGLAATPDGRRVTGARVQPRDGGAEEVLGADLVVDATGRGSARRGGWRGSGMRAHALGDRRDPGCGSCRWRASTDRVVLALLWSFPRAETEPNMRRALCWLVTTAALLGAQLAAAGPAAAGPGDLDPGFGNGGRTTTRFAGDAGAGAAVVQGGKVVAAGFAVTGATTDFALARYRPNGTLDPSFGNHGRVTTDVAGGVGDVATALAVQADGKLVAAGSATFGANQDFAVARYNPNGTPDLSFGTGGRATLDFAGAFDEARALVLQGGKLVAAGLTFPGDAASGDFALARFTAAGRPDGTFGTGGRVITDFAGGFDDARALVLQNGKLVAAGAATTGSGPDFALARYDGHGSLDPTFGSGGKVTTDFAPVFGDADEINALVVQQGKLVAAGSSFTGGGLRFDFALARYRPNGALDASFGTGGKVTTDFARREDRAQALVLQGGRPVAVGSAVTGSGTQTFALARYLS